MIGQSFARLALGAGIAAFLIVFTNGIPPALAWPPVVVGAGLWIAALWEARAGQRVSKAVLWGGGLVLALAATLPYAILQPIAQTPGHP